MHMNVTEERDGVTLLDAYAISFIEHCNMDEIYLQVL
jgi:hypothetical protein